MEKPEVANHVLGILQGIVRSFVRSFVRLFVCLFVCFWVVVSNIFLMSTPKIGEDSHFD